jgi:hypothetical protein
MLREYKVRVHGDAHYYVESPKCPSEWKGSGCYDIEVKSVMNTDVVVWAKSEEEARKCAEEYDYQGEYCGQIDDVNVVSVELVRDLPYRGEDEVGVIEPVFIEWN